MARRAPPGFGVLFGAFVGLGAYATIAGVLFDNNVLAGIGVTLFLIAVLAVILNLY